MVLRNLNIVGSDGLKDILIENERIVAVSGILSGDLPAGSSLHFPDALAFPGLINSHDHLDFNLFPPLANRVYNNYTEWGTDIQQRNRQQIDPVLKIPQPLRTRWGIYKNLLNGVTTVVNHGAKGKIEEDLITVFQDCHCLHSVGFEKNWKWKLNRPFVGARPFALHVGEGTDEKASREIDQLIRWNFFNRPLIGIHGVAMREDQAAAFKALVWCPATNYFLLGRTAPVARLKRKTRILFGTDSTLTAGWNIWEHLRLARKEGSMTDMELLDTLSTAPAAAWGLTDHGDSATDSGKLALGRGKLAPGRGELAASPGVLAPGRIADLVVARPKKGLADMDAFFAIDPDDILLVLSRGRVSLFDASLYDALSFAGLAMENFHPVRVGDDRKYVRGDLPGLVKKVREYYPAATFPFRIG